MKGTMRLLDARSNLMKCRVCGDCHLAMIKPGGGYHRGARTCRNGCTQDDLREGIKNGTILLEKTDRAREGRCRRKLRKIGYKMWKCDGLYSIIDLNYGVMLYYYTSIEIEDVEYFINKSNTEE